MTKQECIDRITELLQCADSFEIDIQPTMQTRDQMLDGGYRAEFLSGNTITIKIPNGPPAALNPLLVLS